MNNEKIALFTGGFDPVHSGHIDCIIEASKVGNLVIGLNSDSWLARKKGQPFMPFSERQAVLNQFKQVQLVIDFDDSDNTACDAIAKTKKLFTNNQIVFVNGGDRNQDNIPEICKFQHDNQIEFLFSVGGESKKNSSSWILENWKYPKTVRPWGYYRVLYSPNKNVKLKELVVKPGQSLSMQQHDLRNELWFVSEGIATVRSLEDNRKTLLGNFEKYSKISINRQQWHQLENKQNVDLHIIEIQYGENCLEEDIQRINL